MGSPAFAVTCAEAVRESGHEIAAVVTVPDKPAGRGLKPRQSAVKTWALAHDLPVLQPASLRAPDFLDAIRALAADVFVVVAFKILPRELYAIPPRGAFNLHASLLPKYRGAAPINWAIINGEHETGVTTFFLQDKVDTGALILQERITIGEQETAGELHDRLATLGAGVVVRTLALIEAGTAIPQPQDESLACPAPKLTTETGHIVWSSEAQSIHNLVRGLAPSPGAWTTLHGKTFKIHRTQCTDLIPEPAYPGECVIEHGRLFVKTADVLIELMDVQLEGRARQSGAQFFQGRGVHGGDILV